VRLTVSIYEESRYLSSPDIRISREQAQNGDAFHVTVRLPDAADRGASSLKIGFSDGFTIMSHRISIFFLYSFAVKS
jgi:hypothetical protein